MSDQKQDFRDQPKAQHFGKPAEDKKVESKKAAAKAQQAELVAPKVEVVDMERTMNPEDFKPKDPEAIVVAKPHPANPSAIATQNVMRNQIEDKSDKELADEVYEKNQAKDKDSKAAA